MSMLGYFKNSYPLKQWKSNMLQWLRAELYWQHPAMPIFGMLPPRWGSIHYINRRILHDDCSQQFTMPTGINMTFCQKPLIKDTNTGIPTLSECSMSSIDSALPSRSDSGRTAITGYVRNFVILWLKSHTATISLLGTFVFKNHYCVPSV